MYKSPITYDLIKSYCSKVILSENEAVKMMIEDLETHFDVCDENEIEFFENCRFGYVGVSYVDGNVVFVKKNGSYVRANQFDGVDFNEVLSVWYAFHNSK